MILIPEGLVSLVIGAKGKQINAFMKESEANIVVNQPVIGMNLRSVSMKGQLKHILSACSSIYGYQEKYASSVDEIDINKKAVNLNLNFKEPIAKDKIKTKVKFILKEEAVGFLIGKKGSFTRYMQEELDIYFKCERERDN